MAVQSIRLPSRRWRSIWMKCWICLGVVGIGCMFGLVYYVHMDTSFIPNEEAESNNHHRHHHHSVNHVPIMTRKIAKEEMKRAKLHNKTRATNNDTRTVTSAVPGQQLSHQHSSINNNNSNATNATASNHKVPTVPPQKRQSTISENQTALNNSAAVATPSHAPQLKGNTGAHIRGNDHPPKNNAATTTTTTTTTTTSFIKSNNLLQNPHNNDSRNNKSNSSILPPRVVPYLGVLVDSGRHLFSFEWLYNLVDTLAKMNYNFIHFRLTDDQIFALPVIHTPNNNNSNNINNNHDNKKIYFSGTSFSQQYKTQELRDWVRYAKTKHNITIMPEVNVPGHAGAWGYEFVVPCAEFSCQYAYGLPLNVTHPGLKGPLTSILKKVVDVFDRPPYLHLGGDEIWMASGCLREVGIDINTTWYNAIETFEKDILTDIITNDLGYDMSQIIRWENEQAKDKYRAGGIDQWWLNYPSKDEMKKPWFVSTGLYMDQIRESAHGWGDYEHARKILDEDDDEDDDGDNDGTQGQKSQHTRPPNHDDDDDETSQRRRRQQAQERKPARPREHRPHAIIVGGFELSEQYWIDRNVLGRLLAVSMAATENDRTLFSENAFNNTYKKTCTSMGWNATLCNLMGHPATSSESYIKKWTATWKRWKTFTCLRLAHPKKVPQVYRINPPAYSLDSLNHRYWDMVASPSEHNTLPALGGSEFVATINVSSLSSSSSSSHPVPLLPKSRTVGKVGVLLDLVRNNLNLEEIKQVFSMMQMLGLSWVQLRLASDDGFVMDLDTIPDTALRIFPGMSYSRKDMEEIARTAEAMNIEVVPELSLTTNAGGLSRAQMVASCPEHICSVGRNIAMNKVEEAASKIIQRMLVAVGEANSFFAGSNATGYLHLGYDEREASAACLNEAGLTTDWSLYERKLSLGLQLLGIDTDSVIRWENQERKRYSPRTGQITQYTTLPAENNSIADQETDNLWGSLALKGSKPWEIYQRSRKWSHVNPFRLVADTSFGAGIASEALKQLVAFAIGVSDTKERTKGAFQKTHAELCERLKNRSDTVLKDHPLTSRIQELDTGCMQRTTKVTKYFPKKTN